MKQKCLHEVSKSILLEETIELRQILELIYNSKDEVSNNEIYIALIPIISSVCLGWLEIFKEEDLKMDVFKIGDSNFEELLKSSRIGLKLYSDKKLSKAGKLLKKIRENLKPYFKQIIMLYKNFLFICLGNATLEFLV